MTANDAAKTTKANAWRLFFGVLLLALLVRGGSLWLLQGRLTDDPDAYRQLAQGLLHTGVYTRDVPLDAGQVPTNPTPSAFRPPLYPLVLAKIAAGKYVPPLRIALLHGVLGLATVALTFRLGLDWELGEWGAALAALLVALDPILNLQAAQVMTETLATFLAVACLWQLTRYSRAPSFFNALGVGALVGLAVLCRPTFLPWSALIVLVMVLNALPVSRKAVHVLGVSVGVLLLLAPWIGRNYQTLGRPIAATTHGGYTLWLANNPSFYESLRQPTGVAWTVGEIGLAIHQDTTGPVAHFIHREEVAEVPLPASLNDAPMELLEDETYQQLALSNIRAQPGMFLWSCVMRAYYLWSPLAQRTATNESLRQSCLRYGVALWYVALYLLALAGLWRLRWRALHAPWVWGLTLCLTFTLMHAVYWSNLRMRAPLMPVVALLATCGAQALLSRRVGL